jgi:hypothetical protein
MSKAVTKSMMTRRVITYELIACFAVMLFLWIDELLDVPHHLFGVEPTPINWVESLLESGFIIVLCTLVITISYRFLQRIKYLEGFLRICAFCKRIRIEDKWIPLDQFVSDHSAAMFSHGYCPECLEKHYGELLRKQA